MMGQCGRKYVGLVVLAAAVVASVPGRAGADTAQLRRHDAALEVTFELALDSLGGAVVRAVSPRFSFEKTTTASGQSRRTLSTRDDEVVIEHGPSGTHITTRKGRVTIGPGTQAEESLKAARLLLAGSPAVAMFKGLVASVAARSGRDDFHATSLLLDATFVAALESDALAFDSLARRVLERAAPGNDGDALVRVAWRPARLVARDDEFRDCLSEYYAYVSNAWSLLRHCIIMLEDDPFWARGGELWWCQREFEIRMATGVTQFAACAAVGL